MKEGLKLMEENLSESEDEFTEDIEELDLDD